MPKLWENCIKIHEGCGGVCRWVEAVNRPGVGYHGECLCCGEEPLPREHMIPVEHADHEELPRGWGELSKLSWDDDASWAENQERLEERIRGAPGVRKDA